MNTLYTNLLKDENYKIISETNNKITLKAGNVFTHYVTTEYEYKMTDVIKDGNLYELSIVSFNENNGCITFYYDKKENMCYINELSNNSDCIKCSSDVKINIGVILMQIVLNICFTRFKVNRVELQDSSYINLFSKNKIKLLYLRTLTKGEPYYIKFGFRPCDNINEKIYLDNKKIFKLNKVIEYGIFKKIVENTQFYKDNNESVDRILRFYIKPSFNNTSIEISELINNIINFSKDIKDYKYLFSDLLENIYIKLYEIIGYKPTKFILNKNDYEYILHKEKITIK